MNKELGRKITSLTLMTIMLTWTSAMGFSMTFMPEAEAANQYLWVSVEDAGGSKFYGGQVLEIVVTIQLSTDWMRHTVCLMLQLTVRKLSWHRVLTVLGMHTLLMARKQPQSTKTTQK